MQGTAVDDPTKTYLRNKAPFRSSFVTSPILELKKNSPFPGTLRIDVKILMKDDASAELLRRKRNPFQGHKSRS